MEFQEVVARRRMVRHFASEPVERAVLERIGLTAQRTPSAGFSQRRPGAAEPAGTRAGAP